MIGCDSELCIRLSNGGSFPLMPVLGGERAGRHPFVDSVACYYCGVTNEMVAERGGPGMWWWWWWKKR